MSFYITRVLLDPICYKLTDISGGFLSKSTRGSGVDWSRKKVLGTEQAQLFSLIRPSMWFAAVRAAQRQQLVLRDHE